MSLFHPVPKISNTELNARFTRQTPRRHDRRVCIGTTGDTIQEKLELLCSLRTIRLDEVLPYKRRAAQVFGQAGVQSTVMLYCVCTHIVQNLRIPNLTGETRSILVWVA